MDWVVLRRNLLEYYGSMNAPGGGLWPEGAAESLPFGFGPHQQLLAGLRRVGHVWTTTVDNVPEDEEQACLSYRVATSSGQFIVSVSFVGPYVAAFRDVEGESTRYVVSRASSGLSREALGVLSAIKQAGFQALTLAEMRTRTELNVSEFKGVDVYQALIVNHSPTPDAEEDWGVE